MAHYATKSRGIRLQARTISAKAAGMGMVSITNHAHILQGRSIIVFLGELDAGTRAAEQSRHFAAAAA